MRPTTLQTIHNQPPLSDHSTQSVSVLGLSQPPFSNQCNHLISALWLSQAVENMHLTPSRSLSGVSLATAEARGGGSEKQNERREKNKKKAIGDSKTNFTLKDYNNISCYIKEEENYDCLFGKSICGISQCFKFSS
ncbi:hypothetical protein O181_107041 [Austropuccinia psidii MF-1]|uniref:Uncharacterized protein n=1 Tax=Austropuccinia psidii MF-1 TaxID=1389203 RepID=A0A9Q3JSK4_9BASI|nr:hypothetical protein [Austropuccinia psidii MF-1]